MRQLFRFMFHHASHLTFGAMLMAMSSFGQTYFVSLYGQDFREAFGLTDGGLGGLYAIGTVMSAITLTWAGRLIDYTTTRRFTLAVTIGQMPEQRVKKNDISTNLPLRSLGVSTEPVCVVKVNLVSWRKSPGKVVLPSDQ